MVATCQLKGEYDKVVLVCSYWSVLVCDCACCKVLMGIIQERKEKNDTNSLFCHSVILAHLSFLPFCYGGERQSMKGEEKKMEIFFFQNSGMAFCNELKKKTKKGKPFAHAPYNSCSGEFKN